MSKIKKIFFIVFISALLIIPACIFITAVDQPSSANVGETITVTLDIEIDESDGAAGDGPTAGLTAVLMPIDWTVVSVEYDGDYGPEFMVYLHPDSADIQVGAGTDYWYDSLAVNYPPPAGMDWYVYQGPVTHLWLGDTTHVTVTFELTTGAAGTYNLGYYAHTADLTYEDPDWPGDISLNHSITVGTSSIDAADNEIVNEFSLAQNFPNPFNPTTTIKYNLKKGAQVNLVVYDLKGSQIAELVNTYQKLGQHQVKFNAVNLTSGIYLYKITAGEFVQTNKMALIK